jgi:hypothetical protein
LFPGAVRFVVVSKRAGKYAGHVVDEQRFPYFCRGQDEQTVAAVFAVTGGPRDANRVEGIAKPACSDPSEVLLDRP